MNTIASKSLQMQHYIVCFSPLPKEIAKIIAQDFVYDAEEIDYILKAFQTLATYYHNIYTFWDNRIQFYVNYPALNPGTINDADDIRVIDTLVQGRENLKQLKLTFSDYTCSFNVNGTHKERVVAEQLVLEMMSKIKQKSKVMKNVVFEVYGGFGEVFIRIPW